MALLWQRTEQSFGAAGADVGEGIQVSLVNGFAGGGSRAGSIAGTEIVDHQREHVIAAAQPPVGAEAASEVEPLPAQDQRQSEPQAADSANVGHSGDAASTREGAAGAQASKGGDPDSTDLLTRVARCLPPEFRPQLALTNLVMSLDDKGQLRAPPQVVSNLPRLTAEDRLAADRVVQAALLCGPYGPGNFNSVVTVPADFSGIRPKLAVAGVPGGSASAATAVR